MSDRKCPRCGTELEPFGEVDIGVGVQTFGPWGCPACHWIEADEDEADLTEAGHP